MYPAYKLKDVLDEYAITFYSLLNEGYRLIYANAVLLAQIADLPYADEQSRKEFYRNLEYASTHPSDILKSDDNIVDPDQLKKMLGGT